MSFFMKHLIRKRLKNLSVATILQYAHTYEFSIDTSEAKQIKEILQTTDFDPLSKSDHAYVFLELEKITSEETAKKARKLLYQLLEEHGFTKYLYE
ncbi:MAG TPA: DUF2624 family protein [Bacillota bacterium]|nr:DUF2624 family protein [Bacillota bacterium]